jgi:hypothetical protein
MSYPLGHFWMAAAVSELPGRGGWSRMWASTCGIWWTTRVSAAGGAAGRRERHDLGRRVCHAAGRHGTRTVAVSLCSHGVPLEDARARTWPCSMTTRRIRDLESAGHGRPAPVSGTSPRVPASGRRVEHLYFGEVFPPCASRPTGSTTWIPRPTRCSHASIRPATHPTTNCCWIPKDRVHYHWQRGGSRSTQAVERRLIAAGRLPQEQARFLPVDTDTGQRVLMHRGSVRWNEYRQRWIMIATQKEVLLFGRSLVFRSDAADGSLASSQENRHARPVQLLQSRPSSLLRPGRRA